MNSMKVENTETEKQIFRIKFPDYFYDSNGNFKEGFPIKKPKPKK